MKIQTCVRTLTRRFFMLLTVVTVPLLASNSAPAAPELECGIRLCFKTPQYFSANYNRLYFNGRDIFISGVNLNHAVDSATAPLQILFALRTRGTSPLQLFNQNYVAAQLSMALVPLPTVFGAYNTDLGCYNLNFDPIKLSNGATLSPEMRLGEFFTQCDLAGLAPYSAERDDDMRAIVSILTRLNTCR